MVKVKIYKFIANSLTNRLHRISYISMPRAARRGYPASHARVLRSKKPPTHGERVTGYSVAWSSKLHDPVLIIVSSSKRSSEARQEHFKDFNPCEILLPGTGNSIPSNENKKHAHKCTFQLGQYSHIWALSLTKKKPFTH